jgi:L-rhamnose-H+ transport protein
MMNLTLFAGAALILLGGALQGTFAVPMKYTRKWNLENTWLLFSLTGMIVFPWLLAAGTVPALAQVYAVTSLRVLSHIVLSGLLWGVGAALVGVGLDMLGIGLGFAIILGLSAAVGSVVPLLLLTPQNLFTPQGRYYMLGALVMFAGIAVLAVAGSLRQRNEESQAAGAPRAKGSFALGLLICIAAGVLSAALNFCYAFGAEAVENARRLGASAVWASNVAAAPGTTGGFVANFVYCAWRMRKNRSLHRYWLPGTAGHWLLATVMGAFWFGGLALYGMGISRMGAFGAVAGWPLLMGTVIVSSNAAGFLTSEWTQAGRRAKAYLLAGSGVVLVALAILAMAQRS